MGGALRSLQWFKDDRHAVDDQMKPQKVYVLARLPGLLLHSERSFVQPGIASFYGSNKFELGKIPSHDQEVKSFVFWSQDPVKVL